MFGSDLKCLKSLLVEFSNDKSKLLTLSDNEFRDFIKEKFDLDFIEKSENDNLTNKMIKLIDELVQNEKPKTPVLSSMITKCLEHKLVQLKVIFIFI